MNKNLFRQKSIDRVSSPEQLNDYVRVPSPGVWAVLAAVIVLLIGAFAWGILGRLETTVPAIVVSENNSAVCCFDVTYSSEVAVGMTVRAGGAELLIASVSSDPSRLSDYLQNSGTDGSREVCASDLSGSIGDGIYEAEIVVESIAPMSFLWN